MATVTVAPGSGFCPGVKRAAELLVRELEAGSKVFCLGELIHNRPYNE
ncbi:MAG: hypothetical protein J6U75_04040 [Clostridia bacterium]|nr:hypothetical protein [Clostridia bacterium]